MTNIILASRKLGSFDWANEKEKQAAWTIELPQDCAATKLRFSCYVEPDGKYDYKSDCESWWENDPWEVIDILEQHLINEVWISSSKAENLALIKWIRDNRPKLRPAWLKKNIEIKQKRLNELQSLIDSYQEEIDELQGEIA